MSIARQHFSYFSSEMEMHLKRKSSRKMNAFANQSSHNNRTFFQIITITY